MSINHTSTLPLPSPRISDQLTDYVDVDKIRANEVAGPFFDAGGHMICYAERPSYEGDLYRPDVHWFALIVKGKMQVQLGKQTYIAEAGDLVCIPAGTKTKRKALGPLAWIYIILYDVPVWAPLKQLGHSIRRYESADMMYILVRSILEALRRQDVFSVESASENASMLVKLLRRELRQPANEQAHGRMDRLIELLDKIRENPAHDWDRAAMAREVGTTERNLTRIFARTFGISPAKMILSIRMDIAVRMLMNTDMPISAVAESVGYKSQFSFSRLFAKHVGDSPDHYRKTRRSVLVESHSHLIGGLEE